MTYLSCTKKYMKTDFLAIIFSDECKALYGCDDWDRG